MVTFKMGCDRVGLMGMLDVKWNLNVLLMEQICLSLVSVVCLIVDRNERRSHSRQRFRWSWLMC